MADEPMNGVSSLTAPPPSGREAVLAAACNVLARHHHRVTGGSTPAGMPSRPSPDAAAGPGLPGAGDPEGRRHG